MTENARPEYVTDVPYVRSFETDLCPSRLRLVAALNGFVPPPSHDFDYCELGCAHGDTTAALAAAYPKARFVGVDINPDHIASARALAVGGELENLELVEKDFEQLLQQDLPDFDFIGAHGVLSWVGPKKRKAALDFARAKLKPGGLFMVSYNALPGWAAVEPLRQLIVARGDQVQGSSLERARHGLEFAKEMSKGGAEYFTQNPGAKAMLGTMERHGLAYVVHEYLHAHWVPMYFAQVASEMAAEGLYFVGQLPLYLNYRDLAVPHTLGPLFQGIADRVTFESLKDFANNEYFRRDVFIKGRAARSEGVTHDYLDSVPLGTLFGEGGVQRDVVLPHQTLHFVGEIFDGLLPALAEGATTVTALASRPELAGFGVQRIREAVLRLVIGGQASPMQEPTRESAASEIDRFRVPSAFNRWTLQQALAREGPAILASSVAGTAFEVALVEVVALLLLTEVEPQAREAWVRSLCQRQSFRLFLSERPVTDKAEQERVLLGEVQRLQATKLRKLVELGILERA